MGKVEVIGLKILFGWEWEQCVVERGRVRCEGKLEYVFLTLKTAILLRSTRNFRLFGMRETEMSLDWEIENFPCALQKCHVEEPYAHIHQLSGKTRGNLYLYATIAVN